MVLTAAERSTLLSIEQRVLWLAVRMVDATNRSDAGGIKVGGHQASSASMVSIMTALWFSHIASEDKVSIKPHASPVYHAIKYLTGELDRSYLTKLRRRGGLQAYPSRTKDPDVADFSTGSVGLGAVAPLFSAAVRRYVDAHFGSRPPARFVATLGDAELDEGNVWEAISDPAVQGLGNVMFIVDLNRQSLDRVVPEIQANRLRGFFSDAGWHVTEAKYGRHLENAFAEEGGDALRQHIDSMSNEHYQSLFAEQGKELRKRFLEGADSAVKMFISSVPDEQLARLVFDLGGHDLDVLVDRYRACDQVVDRPSVVFAYTVKGWGLPIAGDPLNHAALLSPSQIDALRTDVGLNEESEWDRFDSESPEGRWCNEVGARINNVSPPPRPENAVPTESGAVMPSRAISTQEAFGRILVSFAEHSDLRRRMVTVSPDVSVSTNLGSWINKTGVFSPIEGPSYFGDGLLRWSPGPDGHHIELGISEMNLFMLLGQLGLSHEHHGETLLPIGTVYDPFVLRGLDAFVYSLYNDGRFVVVGTPSGISLAPEGGAHQSTVTPAVGLGLPGVAYCEPAFSLALDWILCDGLAALTRPQGESLYLRLSTRPIDQTPFTNVLDRIGAEQLRRDVLAGGYRLREPQTGGEALVIATSGVLAPEALAAADILEDEGAAVTVVDVTSADRLFRSWADRNRTSATNAAVPADLSVLGRLIEPSERRAPILTIHDAAPHALAWIGAVFGAPTIPVGVEEFGESGTIPELYEKFQLRPDDIVNAGIVALSLSSQQQDLP